MSKIVLSGAQWTWVGASFAESAGIYKSLGVTAMDLIAVPGGALEASAIAADPKRGASRVQGIDIDLANILVIFGDGFADRAINSADEAVRRDVVETYKGLLEFCGTAGLKSICILPGVEQEGMSREDAQKLSAEAMHGMDVLARNAGILMVYEAHRESILESPTEILAFAQSHPDLKLCIDHAHCLSIGYALSEMEPLLPFAGHVHLRQGAKGKIQARWDEGEIDFPALMKQLEKTGYKGYATLEYEHEEFWDMDKCDVMTETIKMRNAVRPFVS
jgi:sugar phosphate isomerase/epimerase